MAYFNFPSCTSFIHIGSIAVTSNYQFFPHIHRTKVGTEDGGAERPPKYVCRNFMAYIHV